MKDERSKDAIIVAINFGKGLATKEELDAAYADAAYAADAAADANVDANVAKERARTANKLKTANICRKYLTQEVFKLINN